jgi:hypothetical protein
MTKLPPIGIVVDRRAIDDFRPAINKLGGAFVEMFEAWERLTAEYLILLAHTQKRLRFRTPLTFICVNDQALREAMRIACSRIDGLRMTWMIHLTKGSSAESIVRKELLSDAKCGGAG